jgi:hypothetical protein
MSQKFAHLNADGKVLGFYADDFHEPHQIPDGAVPITDEQHQALLAGQSVGKVMHVIDGEHALKERPAPTGEELATMLRDQRTAALSTTDWIATRHMEEAMAGGATTLSKEQAAALFDYRKALRDLPAAKGFPNVALPVAPDFIGVK